jgi:selT/selW/selH-like putative selenoprotein
MKRNFLYLQKFLEDTFPELSGKITGGNYPPPPIIEILLKILSGVQLFAMALIVFGDRVWTSMLRFRQVPSWYYPIKAYGFQFGVALFFVIPNILNHYVVTGAFEILVDGELAYSKLETGRLPTAGDILAVFEKVGLVASKI